MKDQKYLYRVVNHKKYISVSGSSLTTTAASVTNKFDIKGIVDQWLSI